MTVTPFPTGRARRAANIGVFCAASLGVHPAFRDVAERFGTAIGRRGAGLVYGGGEGLMGVVADAATAAGAPVTAVVPYHLRDASRSDNTGVRLFVARSMHTRKELVYRMSAAFAILPGGLGTLDELMEVASWNKLKLHDKPTVLINAHGFFDKLLEFLDSVVEAGFVGAAERATIRAVDDVDEALDLLSGNPVSPRSHAA